MTTAEESEAAARAKVVESVARVEKILTEIQATLKQLRDAGELGDGGKGVA